MANDTPQILITAQLNKAVSIQNITADLKQIEKQLPSLNLKYNIDSTTLNNTKQSTDKVTKSTQDLSAQLEILKNRTTGAAGSFQSYLETNTKISKQFPNEVENIKKSFRSLSNESDLGKFKTGLSGVRSEITALKGEAKATGAEGKTILSELQNDASKMFNWLASGTLLFGAINQIKQMITTVYDLNKAATDLQMVMGGSAQQTAQLLSQYNALGQQLGATTSEVASSASEWLRQGKSIADTNTLIQDSMILSKVANIDSADSTTYLTSAMKGYNVSVKDTLGIVDKLNAVDLVSATSAAGLAEGMSKTANAANLAGISMNKLIGYEAVIGETTQKSMDEVGTSLQAIFSRLGNVAAGKDIDAEGESLNNVETVLTKVGIKLRDSQNSFRNFGDVLDDVSGKWKSYSNVEQNQIATAIAGKQSLVLEYTVMYSVAV